MKKAKALLEGVRVLMDCEEERLGAFMESRGILHPIDPEPGHREEAGKRYQEWGSRCQEIADAIWKEFFEESDDLYEEARKLFAT